jgi:hypothetical protein
MKQQYDKYVTQNWSHSRAAPVSHSYLSLLDTGIAAKYGILRRHNNEIESAISADIFCLEEEINREQTQ